MTLILKNVYIEKVDNILYKDNNRYQNTIKMKLDNVKSRTYIDSSKENNDADPKFKIDDNIKISQYKNIFAKAFAPN